MKIRIGILTVSDRSFRGERADASGPTIKRLVLEQLDAVVEAEGLVPDERGEIADKLTEWCDEKKLHLIFTTGGTGFGPRDITPEATKDVIERETPGFPEAMRMEGFRITPHALLSRGTAGIRGKTLIINLPGSPKAVREGLELILPAIPHAISTIIDAPDKEHHTFPSSK